MQKEDETFRLRCCIYARMFHRKCVGFSDGDSVGRRLAPTVAIGADVDDDDNDDDVVDGDEDKTMM